MEQVFQKFDIISFGVRLTYDHIQCDRCRKLNRRSNRNQDWGAGLSDGSVIRVWDILVDWFWKLFFCISLIWGG